MILAALVSLGSLGAASTLVAVFVVACEEQRAADQALPLATTWNMLSAMPFVEHRPGRILQEAGV